MGRSGGCCNFQHSANCTAPPCPSGSCCYVTEPISSDNLTNLHEAYRCEDGVTENCCLSKPFSLFNEGAECGIQEACQSYDSSFSWTIPEVYSSNKAFALLKQDGKFAVWGAFVKMSELGSPYEDASVYYSKLNEFNKDFKFVDCVANKEGFLFLNHDGAYRLFGSNSFASTVGSSSHTARLKKGSIVPINSFLVGSDLTVPKETDVRYYPSQGGFAGISTEGKLVIIWNRSFFFNKEESLPVEIKDKTDFVEVASCHRFVAAKDSTGKVYIISLPYGYLDFRPTGGYSGGTGTSQEEPEIVYEVENVHKIYTNNQAFAFVHSDKTVSVWGDENKGGNTGINQSFLTDIKEIYNTDEAFLALREDGKIVVWGDIQSNANPSSMFYDIVREVHPSRTCFGIVYDKDNRSYFDIVGSFFSYSQGVGRVNFNRSLVVTKTYHPTEAEVCEQVNHSSWVGCLDAVTTSLPILLGNNIQDKYPWSSTPRSENLEHHFIFASNWAFYIMDAYIKNANFFLTRDGSRFYVVGATPDNEPTGHSTKLDYDVLNPRYISGDFIFRNGNRNKEDRTYLYFDDNCAQLDTSQITCEGEILNDGVLSNVICPDSSWAWHTKAERYVDLLNRDVESCLSGNNDLIRFNNDPDSKVRKFTRTQNIFAFTERASSFLMNNWNGSVGFQALVPFAPHLHSIGHINYGGWGGTISSFRSSRGTGTGRAPLHGLGNFYGIFSNNNAFCAIMAFVEDETNSIDYLPHSPSRVKFLIKTWGDQRYGGKSPFDPIRPHMGQLCGEEFRSESFGEIISQLTLGGCHPDHCNQDIK